MTMKFIRVSSIELDIPARAVPWIMNISSMLLPGILEHAQTQLKSLPGNIMYNYYHVC